MTTSTPIAESKLFRVVGIRMPSAAQQQAAQQAMIARLHLATRNGEMDWTQLNVPSNPVSAVYEDESGARFIGLSTPYGPQMIEYDNAPEFDPMSNTSDGGFLALDQLNSMSSNQDAAQPMMMSTLTTDAAKSLMSKPKSDGGPSIAESILKSMAMGMGQKAVGNVLVGLASGEDNDKLIDDFVASTTTADGLTKLGASLASGLISNVIGMGVSAAMSKWEIDDESSTAEHAAKKAAEAMVGKIQSELMGLIDEQIANALGTAGPTQAPVPPGSSPKSLTEKVTEFFTGPTSTASVPVGCIGCGNTNDGIVLTGGPTVMVGGLPVSRLSDKVTITKPIPDIGPLMSGNPTVLSLSLATAGDGHVAVGGKGIVTLLQNCVATVLMGPQGMPVVTPTPKDTAEKTGSANAERSKNRPKESKSNGEKQNKKKLPTEEGNRSQSDECQKPKDLELRQAEIRKALENPELSEDEASLLIDEYNALDQLASAIGCGDTPVLIMGEKEATDARFGGKLQIGTSPKLAFTGEQLLWEVKDDFGPFEAGTKGTLKAEAGVDLKGKYSEAGIDGKVFIKNDNGDELYCTAGGKQNSRGETSGAAGCGLIAAFDKDNKVGVGIEQSTNKSPINISANPYTDTTGKNGWKFELKVQVPRVGGVKLNYDRVNSATNS